MRMVGCKNGEESKRRGRGGGRGHRKAMKDVTAEMVSACRSPEGEMRHNGLKLVGVLLRRSVN
eukprot:12928334-Prorocentrum_lima.AAC.1